MGPGIGVDDASAWAQSSAVMPVRPRRILGLLTARPTRAVAPVRPPAHAGGGES
ncbi:hypothetical protein [Streptomyces mirabilis]|uniref:hypothetical protein n=1 Tax=Streptomyces mirabilis TaxID=68239 RepID=UPI00324EF71B